MNTTELIEEGIMKRHPIPHHIASSNPLYYYTHSLKSPHFIYRWLAVWKI